MKRCLLAAACLALAGPACAADPPPAPDCPPARPLPYAAKYCVPVPAMKTTDKVVYDDRCVDYCLPHCSLWTILGCGCGDCLHCGRPRTRHVLIKKFVHEECPDLKCEVREAPCAVPCAPAH